MIEFILIAAVSFWFAELSTIPQRIIIAFKLKKFYPFSCSKCLGFWFGLNYGLVVLPVHLAIFYACVTSLLSIIYSRAYYKLLS